MEMDSRTKGEYVLAVFRILIGWIMLWPFFDKMFGLGFQTPAGSGFFEGGSPSSFVTFVSGGIFEDFYNSLAGNLAVDIILLAALLILGVTLILGIASKLTTIGTVAFLVVMYSLHVPPTDNPLIDFRIILSVGIVAVYLLDGFDYLSLNAKWKETWLVKKFPIFG